MMDALQFLFHLVAASTLGYGLYYDTVHVVIPEEFKYTTIEFAGRWKYLTFLNAVI